MAEEQPAEQPAEEPAPQPAEQPAPAPQPAAEPAPVEQAQQPSGGGGLSIPFILALVGGILVLAHGAVMLAMPEAAAQFTAMIPGLESLLVLGDMGSYAALAFGVIVVVGAVLMRMAAYAKIGSILALILSIAALVTGGGFLAGSILGIAGGILALKG